MLILPGVGRVLSINNHNGRLDVFCDWIEASILFSEDRLSVSDIVDVLIENELYRSQSFARQWVQNGWQELSRRKKWANQGCSYAIDNKFIKRLGSWDDNPAHAFCVLLALATYYDWWTVEFGSDYNEQGHLFELVTQKSIETQFADWYVFRTGWASSNVVQLLQVVDEVAQRLCEMKGRIELWDEAQAKELGLDILWYRPFPDNRAGISVYLVQCASGANWRSKLATPDLNAWRSLIQFTTMPKRAFSTPFSFLDADFSRNCVLVDGILLDRCRLLNASRHKVDWVSADLADRIRNWVAPRVQRLLMRSR